MPFKLNGKSVFEEYCFSMWYHMFGRHTFSLNVHISIPNTRSDREMVFKASGSVSKTGQDWLFMQQTIKRPADWAPNVSKGPHYVNIMVKGVRGLSYQSDIALDDLKFVPGPCPEKPPVVREVFKHLTFQQKPNCTGFLFSIFREAFPSAGKQLAGLKRSCDSYRFLK